MRADLRQLGLSFTLGMLVAAASVGCDSADDPSTGVDGGGSGGSGGGTIEDSGVDALAVEDSGADALAGLETFGPADVDLTLGGLNQDLPEPSTTCLDAEVRNWACFAGTVSINGVVRELVCTSVGRIAVNGTSFQCGTPDNESVELAVGWFTAPGTFDNIEDTVPNNLLRVRLAEGEYSSRLPNFVQGRAAGWVNKFVGRLGLSDSVWGAVAATWNASEDGGVEELRIRGTFHIRSNI